MKSNKIIPLYPGYSYHVFGRSNNKELLFKSSRNYHFFLSRIKKYIKPLADIFAFCLIPNHYHLLLRFKTEAFFQSQFGISEAESSKVISENFRKCFISYAKAFNKEHGRYGNLLQRPFKRKLITSEVSFFNLLLYINQNPEKHGLTLNFRNYKWSSFSHVISLNREIISIHELINLFENLQEYDNYHNNAVIGKDLEY